MKPPNRDLCAFVLIGLLEPQVTRIQAAPRLRATSGKTRKGVSVAETNKKDKWSRLQRGFIYICALAKM
jgi:hypothetical protein